jgi:tetratricopeptide (TPR) repeat protein
LGRHDEALEEFTRTEELHHGFLLVQTEIYLCDQVLAGKIDSDAIEWLRELQTLTDLGEGVSTRAEYLARKVTRRAPDCALGYFFLGKAIFIRSPEEAQRALERCMELRPDDTTAIDALGHLGLLQRNQGRVTEARSIWEGIVRDYPDYPQIGLVQMLLASGDAS